MCHRQSGIGDKLSVDYHPKIALPCGVCIAQPIVVKMALRWMICDESSVRLWAVSSVVLWAHEQWCDAVSNISLLCIMAISILHLSNCTKKQNATASLASDGLFEGPAISAHQKQWLRVIWKLTRALSGIHLTAVFAKDKFLTQREVEKRCHWHTF